MQKSWPVLIIVGDATETLDTMYPYYRLQEAGFRPVVAAPEKRRYQMVLHEVKPVGRSPRNGKATRFKPMWPLARSARKSIWELCSREAEPPSTSATIKT